MPFDSIQTLLRTELGGGGGGGGIETVADAANHKQSIRSTFRNNSVISIKRMSTASSLCFIWLHLVTSLLITAILLNDSEKPPGALTYVKGSTFSDSIYPHFASFHSWITICFILFLEER